MKYRLMETAWEEKVDVVILDRLSDSTIWGRKMMVFTSCDLLLKDVLKSVLDLGLPKN